MQHHTRFQWQPNIGILLFVLVFLPVTVGLGFWQLSRAEEKAQILAEQRERTQLEPLQNIDLLDVQDVHLRQFHLQVEFDPERWFLLDNRVRQGRPGYEVLNLARLADTEQLLLVNRGWVPASLDRSELPQVDIPDGPRVISGYFYMPDERFFELGEQVWQGSWPERIQHADPALVASLLDDGEQLLPARLRLAADDPSAFVADWQIVNQQPERHIGYAVQWFAMAFALVILGIFANSNLGKLLTHKRD